MSIVGIYLKREKYSRQGGIGEEGKRNLFSLIKRVAPVLDKAKVKVESRIGDDNSLVERNLLSDKFVHEVKVVKDGDGTINSNDMIEKIQESYEIFRKSRNKKDEK